MPEKVTAAPWELPYPTSVGEVKLGAEDFKELAEATTARFKEKILIVKKYAGSGTLATGELAVQEKTGETFTLPAVGTANQIIGIFSTVAETKVTAAAVIIGDFTSSASMVLSTNQHVILQSTGFAWMIVAGEPVRTQVFTTTTLTTAEAEAGVNPSKVRAAIVNVVAIGKVNTAIAGSWRVSAAAAGSATKASTTLWVNPNSGWKLTAAAVGVETVAAFTLLL